uniref:Uncharacterized protein n=1 Tax=Oryza rufipogon TaxID=4529 RepID=A0A0E0Q257_ORYRU
MFCLLLCMELQETPEKSQFTSASDISTRCSRQYFRSRLFQVSNISDMDFPPASNPGPVWLYQGE